MAILSTGFGKSMIFALFTMAKEGNVLIENLYDCNFASKKYYSELSLRRSLWDSHY